MPQCGAPCGPCGPKFITVQQPPRSVVQKQMVYRPRTIIDKRVIPATRTIKEPKVIYVPRTVMVPRITYHRRTMPDPKIVYCARIVPNPKVVCSSRYVCEPHEICQSMVCQPKPQIVQVPPPRDYLCYKSAPAVFHGKPGCPPCPCPAGSCAGPTALYGGPQPGAGAPSCGPCAPCGPCC